MSGHRPFGLGNSAEVKTFDGLILGKIVRVDNRIGTVYDCYDYVPGRLSKRFAFGVYPKSAALRAFALRYVLPDEIGEG